jgi:hypothetical protein
MLCRLLQSAKYRRRYQVRDEVLLLALDLRVESYTIDGKGLVW